MVERTYDKRGDAGGQTSPSFGLEVVRCGGYFIAAINILFPWSTCQPREWQPADGNGEKTRSHRLGLRAARVSIVVKRFVSPVFVSFSRLCSLTIDSSNRGEVSTMVGVPIRISYSNADTIHGSIMGYEGEWRDHVHTHTYIYTRSVSLCEYRNRDSNRERRAFATHGHTMG